MDLLRIDVGAQLRTLAEARIQGRWAAPAEFVRWAVSRSASRVTVECSTWGFSVTCHGAALSKMEVFHLAAIVDTDQSDQRRHLAIVALEEQCSEIFFFIARTNFELSSTSQGERWILRAKGGREPLREDDTSGRDGLKLKILITGFEAVMARFWLRENCRFAPITVDVDGERVDHGFDQGLFRQNLLTPLEGSLAITMDDVCPLLILLQHGVVSTRATIPGLLPFRAAVELGDLVEYGAPPFRLRESVAEVMPAIVDEAVAFLIRLVPCLPSLDSLRRHRISGVLLDAAAQGLRKAEIMELPLVEFALPHGGLQMLCPREIFEANEELVVVSPGDSIDIRKRTLRLTDDERRHLAAIGDLRLVRPSRRPQEGFASQFRRLRRWLTRMFVGLRSDSVSQDDLSNDERRLLKLLQSSDVRWKDGQVVRWRWSGARRTLMVRRGAVACIARNHKLSSRLCDAVLQDEAWIFAVLFALDEDGEFDLESIAAQCT